jgi:DNA-binding CsgD family transcriptional regulator/PAS domain-containing protein
MQPFIISKLISQEVFKTSRIYTEAMAPAGFEHAMVMVLEAEAASAISLTLIRRREEPDFTATDGKLASTIGPHLLGALRLRHRFAVARSGAMLLDCIDRPLLLFTGDGTLVHANREGQRLLDRRDGLTYNHSRLQGETPAVTKMLKLLLEECDRAARGFSLAPEGVARIRRPSGQPDLVLRAMPLAPSTTSMCGVGAAASVGLIVHDPGHTGTALARIVAEGLGITAAESAVAMRIWEGNSVSEAAAALHLSQNTVKSHLKTIYERVGVNRQTALVRRMALLLATLSRDEAP